MAIAGRNIHSSPSTLCLRVRIGTALNKKADHVQIATSSCHKQESPVQETPLVGPDLHKKAGNLQTASAMCVQQWCEITRGCWRILHCHLQPGNVQLQGVLGQLHNAKVKRAVRLSHLSLHLPPATGAWAQHFRNRPRGAMV